MKIIELKSHDPYLNLAIEEYIFENTKEEMFILWQNEPCIVIGKNQNPYAEINIPLAFERSVRIVRRITGGGAVYHDLGNLNYSFISPYHKEGIDFAYFTKPIIHALKSLGVEVTLSGRNDLVLADGRKISGNAQHSKGDRVLHHGTLLFNSELKVLSELLNVDQEKLKSKAIRSVRSRVANISEACDRCADIKSFIELIKENVSLNYNAEPSMVPICSEIEKLARRNASDKWIFGDEKFVSQYSVSRKKRFEFGSVECNIILEGDIICELSISGDFFEKRPANDLASALCGKSFISPDLSDIKISDYILGMTNSDFISLIRGEYD